jgi:glutamate-ammonia-ligase adenylyltransferase
MKKAASSPVSLAASLVQAPKSGKAGRQKLADLLAEDEAAALAPLVEANPLAASLLAGLAEGSPYLWRLVRRWPEWVAPLLEARFEASLAAILAETRAAGEEGESGIAMRRLRQAKARAALLIAMADLGGVIDTVGVTEALSDFADASVQAALRFGLREAMAARRFTPVDPDRPEQAFGLFVLALGKHGARELNYSSDIDLTIFYEPDAPGIASAADPQALAIQLVKGIVRLLNERTGDGYVQRVDLRLRPDPGLTPIAMPVHAALGYYESVGQNWERAANIKARPIAGDIEAGRAFLKELEPFIWRKYFDYAAIADIHAMKRQIYAVRGHDQITVPGHDLKVGRGGIREIEFFVQTQQLIAGGRHARLRGRATLAVLDELVVGGWVADTDRDRLAEAYRYLRGVEHRLQMIADEQTHDLPTDDAELERFARFCGHLDAASFAADLTRRLNVVQASYAALFEGEPTMPGTQGAMRFDAARDDRETLEALRKLGYRAPPEASALVRRWQTSTSRALRSETARAYIGELAPTLLTEFARGADPDAALAAFDRYLGELPHGLKLLSTLRHSRDLVVLLGQIIGGAPRLAEIVARRPQVMDALLDPAFFGRLPDDEALAVQMVLGLDQSAGAEDFLDFTRRFGQEQRFLIGARVLSGTISAAQAGDAFARLADAVIRTMYQVTLAAFSERHGLIPDQQMAVLAFGKLGGREVTAASDLDLVLLYDFDDAHPESDGQKPLYGSQYFARFTQRLVSALTVQTNAGVLYEVDLRLRPSGRSGPVATSLGSFRDYQRDEAWTWEHMALTRARVVAASPGFAARAEAAIREVLCRQRSRTTVAADVVDMRRAIAEEKGEDDRWNLKYAAGGLVDLEFIAQFLQLVHAHAVPEILDTNTARVFEKAQRAGLIDAQDAEALRAACRLLHNLTQVLRLCLDAPFEPKGAPTGLRDLLTRVSGLPDFSALDADLAEQQAKVRTCFRRLVT